MPNQIRQDSRYQRPTTRWWLENGLSGEGDRVWFSVFGFQFSVFGVWFSVCGVRYVVFGMWCSVCGVRGQYERLTHYMHDTNLRTHESMLSVNSYPQE